MAEQMTYKEFAKHMLARLPADMPQTTKMQHVGAGWRAWKAKQGLPATPRVVKPKAPKPVEVAAVTSATPNASVSNDFLSGLFTNAAVAATAKGASVAGKKVKKAKLSKAAALQKLEAIKAALADML